MRKPITKDFKVTSKKYKIILYKNYLDKGLSLTNYIRYFLLIVGVAWQDVRGMIWVAVIYLISCYFIGLIWFKLDLVWAENEVSNQYNLFVREVRHKLK